MLQTSMVWDASHTTIRSRESNKARNLKRFRALHWCAILDSNQEPAD